MSEVEATVNTEATPAKAAGQVADLGHESAKVDEVSQRLLEESKKNKERYQAEKKARLELEAKLEAREKAELEEQGQYKTLADEYRGKYEKLKDTVVKKDVRLALQEHAAKAGCRLPVEKLMALGDSGLLQYDPESGLVEGAELFVEKVKEEHPFMFEKAQTPSINPMVPNKAAPSGGPLTADQVAKMKPGSKEKDDMWAAALKKVR